MTTEIIRYDQAGQPPTLITTADSPAAAIAWNDFFASLKLQNKNTHQAYGQAIAKFCTWCTEHQVELKRILPAHVANFLEQLPLADSTKKVYRSALKKFFDLLVTRHICLLNPVTSVSTPKVKVRHGKTPIIDNDEIKTLVNSIDFTTLAGLRDRAAIAVLAYTAARVGAVAKLRRGNYSGRPGRMRLNFIEKGGNHTDVAVSTQLEDYVDEYLAAARMKSAAKDCPLFRPLIRKENKLKPWQPATVSERERGRMSENDMCRMVKRKIRQAGLRDELSAHSFRVAVITDLLNQGVPLEDVQELAGHADSRTTKLYDRSERRAGRNLVERITLPF